MLLAEAEPPFTISAPAGWTLGPLIAVGGTAHVYGLERAGASPAVLKIGRWRAADVRARFEVEARVLGTVGPPVMPALVAHGESDGRPYLILERVEGETLAGWMSRTGERSPIAETIVLLQRIASALALLHDAGFVHRDLKPENIVNEPRGVRLLDVGFAAPLRGPTGLTAIGAAVGTPHYSAPEQTRVGGVVDHRADLYALGVIAFEMIAGRPPFSGDRAALAYQHQVCRAPSLREARAVPAELDTLVGACLAKEVAARPGSAREVAAQLEQIVAATATLRGIGPPPEPRPLGRRSEVALVWVGEADPVARNAIAAVNGTLVRRRGGGVVAAFTSSVHESPLEVALAVARELSVTRPVVLHAAELLERRTSDGRLAFYGAELDQAHWIPSPPLDGLVATAPASTRLGGRASRAELAGWFRIDRSSGPALPARDSPEPEPVLVGRDTLVHDVTTALMAGPVVVGISGDPGIGKSRVLAALVGELRARGRDVIVTHPRRRFPGERSDDVQLLAALGDADDLEHALAALGRRGGVLVVDDAHRLSVSLRRALVAASTCAIVVASSSPLFEVRDGTHGRLAISLPALSQVEASQLLRALLAPAHRIPDVLIERLAARGLGIPRLLVALTRALKRRGGVQHQVSNDEWYVAPDELDTLHAGPWREWLAARTLEAVPNELWSMLRACTVLGPRFSAAEVAAVTERGDAHRWLNVLVQHGLLGERAGAYELLDEDLQDVVYTSTPADERDRVHALALAYWRAHPGANITGWLARLAHHGMRGGDPALATACLLALARARERDGEVEYARDLVDRALAGNLSQVDGPIAEAIRTLGGS